MYYLKYGPIKPITTTVSNTFRPEVQPFPAVSISPRDRNEPPIGVPKGTGRVATNERLLRSFCSFDPASAITITIFLMDH